MKNIDSKILKKFFALAGRALRGEWVLIGGTVLPAIGEEHRVTTDIDLACLGKESSSDTLKLMQIAEDLGLPVESINQAGAFFLKKIPGFQKNLIVLFEGERAKIFRPNLSLFLKLKVPRLSESDLNDCLAMVNYTLKNKEPFPTKDIFPWLEKEVEVSSSNERTVKLKRLLQELRKNLT